MSSHSSNSIEEGQYELDEVEAAADIIFEKFANFLDELKRYTSFYIPSTHLTAQQVEKELFDHIRSEDGTDIKDLLSTLVDCFTYGSHNHV